MRLKAPLMGAVLVLSAAAIPAPSPAGTAALATTAGALRGKACFNYGGEGKPPCETASRVVLDFIGSVVFHGETFLGVWHYSTTGTFIKPGVVRLNPGPVRASRLEVAPGGTTRLAAQKLTGTCAGRYNRFNRKIVLQCTAKVGDNEAGARTIAGSFRPYHDQRSVTSIEDPGFKCGGASDCEDIVGTYSAIA